jgi:hypothetical protein
MLSEKDKTLTELQKIIKILSDKNLKRLLFFAKGLSTNPDQHN